MKAAAWSILVKLCFLSLLWAAFIRGSEGARNVLIAIVSIHFVASLYLLSEKGRVETRKRGLPLPEPVHIFYWSMVIAFLAWHGAWWLTAATAISAALTTAAHSESDSTA